MKPHLEIEYKTLLTQAEYHNLDTHFSFDQIVEQTNIYYDDTRKTLFNLGIMCRIRIIEDSYEFTLKVPQDEGVLEYEVSMDSLSLKTPEIETILREYKLIADDLVEVGKSHTVRKIYRDQFGEWCLDDNTFSHHQDYELEYELYGPADGAYEHYLKEMKQLSIEYKQAQPKYIRALESK